LSLRRFTDNELLSIAKVLGDTAAGLSGGEIARLLGSLGFSDPGPITKRERLLAALQDAQQRDGPGHPVARLIESAMDPVNYRGERPKFEERQHDVNVVLSFAGIRLRDDGKLEPVPAAATLSDAERRASKLRSELARRGIAGDVLRFCRPELLEGNYFHAVFEATKSVAQKLRDVTGLTSDGGTLVSEVLSIQGGKTPLLAWNTLVTENEKNEHRGVALMINGAFSYFRNLPAHVPKVGFRTVTEEEALELLTILSFLHRRLDAAVSTRVQPTRPTP
jgi:uncharacterized protein (TIGR02391 family)